MPFPIVIPFVIKGVFVAAKLLSGKAALTKAAVGTTKVLVTQYGAAQTAVIAGSALTIIGGLAWSEENIRRAQRAHALFSEGDYAGAARQLGQLANSVKTASCVDLAADLHDWMGAGMPLDGRLRRLASDAKALADEAMANVR